MAIAAVLWTNSASTTNIRWFLWLFYFLSLFMSQSCLADHDQFNFYHGRLFSRKLCPGRCSMKFELQPFFRDSTVSESMHLSASSNLKRNGMKNRAWKMYLSVSAAAMVLIAVSSTWHMRRRDALFQEEQENIQETGLIESGEGRSGNEDNSHDNLQRGNRAISQRRPVFQLDVIRKFKKYFSFEAKIRNQVGFQGLPSFPFKVILKATQHFSDDRIVGRGSFGVVYKGQLDDGGLIAVKKLFPSRERCGGFINEVSTLPNIQHKNIVKILGYCIETDEKLLIYEFISNGTINDVLFGSSMDIRLAEWNTRKNIINGIARGLLYLHEDSRFRIFHRDIKPSNVLLDDNMNPKISDFGLAMVIFDEDEIQDHFVAGSLGYIAPEYMIHGRFTVKADVYSFGVLLLEIITGKKNRTFLREHKIHLPDYIRRLWSEGKTSDVMDPALKQSCENHNNELMRCIHIGLLCVQDNPTDRPTMSSVVVMLASDDVKLPEPKPIHADIESAQYYSSDIEDMSVHEGSISSIISDEEECALISKIINWKQSISDAAAAKALEYLESKDGGPARRSRELDKQGTIKDIQSNSNSDLESNSNSDFKSHTNPSPPPT